MVTSLRSHDESRAQLIWAFALLTGVTWLLGTCVPKYVPVTSPLPVAGPDFAKSSEWQLTGESSEFEFGDHELTVSRADNGRSHARLSWQRPPRSRTAESRIEFGCHVDCDLPPTRDVRQPRAIVTVWEYGPDEQPRLSANNIVVFRGWGGAGDYATVFHPHPGTERLELVVGLMNSSGHISLSSPVFQVVNPLPVYFAIFAAVLTGWFVFIVCVANHVIESGNGKLLVAPAIIVLVIGSCILMPLSLIDYLLYPLDSLVLRAHAARPDWVVFHFTAGKLGHTLCFAVFTFVASLLKSRFRVSWLQLGIVFCLLALSTEGLQLFLSDRTTRFTDLGFDMVGVGLGLAAYVGYGMCKRFFSLIFLRRKASDASEPSRVPETS